jgi:hypothetical protein
MRWWRKAKWCQEEEDHPACLKDNWQLYSGSSLPGLGNNGVSVHLCLVEKRRAAKLAAWRNCILPYVGPSDQW